MNNTEVLSAAMDIGEAMLKNGAEVYRVEDCVRRICFAYGAQSVDVFSITSSILLTIEFPNEVRITQTRRIMSFVTDLDRVDRLNQLSRRMCSERLDHETFRAAFCEIVQRKRYSYLVETFAFALIAAAFTVFFGGSWQDGLISGAIGMIVKAAVYLSSVVNFNRVLSNLIASFVMSVLAFLSVRFSIARSVEMIVIGNIMLLIPGVILTNSLRDMISGDTMTGILRFAEAIILALAIAGGYILAFYAVGGGPA